MWLPDRPYVIETGLVSDTMPEVVAAADVNYCNIDQRTIRVKFLIPKTTKYIVVSTNLTQYTMNGN